VVKFTKFNKFKLFNRSAPFNSPSSFLPRDAGADEEGGHWPSKFFRLEPSLAGKLKKP